MRVISKISTWSSTDKKDFRVYVSFLGGEQGCYYKTGNSYKAAGFLENISEGEKLAALSICEGKLLKKAWCTVYENEIKNQSYVKEVKFSNPISNKQSYKSYDEEDLDIEDWSKIRSSIK